MEIKQVHDDIFGNCLLFTNGLAELLVTVELGPRIIYFSRVDMENMFFQDFDLAVDGWAVFGGKRMKPYGGHRLWISPEILPRCYYPDDAPVEYTETENGMAFTAPVEKTNLIQKTLTVRLDPDEPKVRIGHKIENCGVWDIELAPWSLTMMDAKCTTIMPVPFRETGALPTMNLSLWGYSDMSDERILWGRKYMVLRQDPEKAPPFKLGYNNEAGWAACFGKSQLFVKRFGYETGGSYPDNGCNYETYVNGAFLEMESLGELVLLRPGECASHDETWEIHEAVLPPLENDEGIDKALEGYIGHPNG